MATVPQIVTQANGQRLTEPNTPDTASVGTLLLDQDWVKNAFGSAGENIDSVELRVNRYWTSANAKFTDTRLGGSIGVNAKPQWCWYSDIREKGRLIGRNDVTIGGGVGNHGMGNTYSSIIDDPAQTVYFRMGVPQFNTLLNFLLNSYDAEASIIARTGRAATWYKVGKVIGSVPTVLLFPGIATFVAAANLFDFFWRRPRYKFYTLKPTMHTYWAAVDNILGGLVTAAGIYPTVMTPKSADRIQQPQKFDEQAMGDLGKLLPDVLVNGRFDAYAIANRAQRLANQAFHEEYNRANQMTNIRDLAGYVRREQVGDSATIGPGPNDKGTSLDAMLNRYASFAYWLYSDSDEEKKRAEFDVAIDPKAEDGKGEPNMGFLRQYVEHLDADFRDGNQFAVFKVDHTGSVQESFSNQAVESELSSKINNFSAQVRELRFSLADMNVVDAALGAAKDAAAAFGQVIQGAISGATFGLSDVITGLAGGAGFIDIPKHWQSSTADLPTASYKMTLMAPANDPIARVQHLYLPLSMLLAMALPIAIGNTAYQSPFLVQCFDRGRLHIRTGMVTSLSINRGTSNLAFDMRGNALAYEVSLTVADLSSIMSMPISTGLIGKLDMTGDEDNLLMDYLASIAGRDLYSQIYNMEKAKLAWTRAVYRAGALMSPAAWASATHESMTSGMFKYLGVGPLIEVMARGTDLGSRSPNQS